MGQAGAPAQRIPGRIAATAERREGRRHRRDGDHARRALARNLDPDRVVVTGYAKYDDFFRAAPDRTAVRERFGLRPTEPVVAYAPTWRDKSSVDRYAEAFRRLSGQLRRREVSWPREATGGGGAAAGGAS